MHFASARQAAFIAASCGKTKANEVRQTMGPLQEFINGSKLAQARYIRQLSTDLSEANGTPILSITLMITMDEEDQECEVIFLKAAHPVEGKEADKVFQAALDVFDATKKRYETFLRKCSDYDLDVSAFPPSSEIRLDKMNEIQGPRSKI